MKFPILRSMTAFATTLLIPSAKIIVGLWFLNASSQLMWKVTKPIIDLARKRQPRFPSGRVDKFYKFTPPRVRKRKERRRKKEVRINWRVKMAVDAIEDRKNAPEYLTDDGEIDMNKLVSESFSICTSLNCCLKFSSTCATTNSCDENYDETFSCLDLGLVKKLPTVTADQIDDNDHKVFTVDANNASLEPFFNAESSVIHSKVVNDLGLKCLPSDSPNDHRHATNTHHRHATNTPLDNRDHLLPPCLTATEVQRTVSSTPFPPTSQPPTSQSTASQSPSPPPVPPQSPLVPGQSTACWTPSVRLLRH
eukprot:GFUD01022330.1.p1 GENE.GFUD01022330.1~~GFUD01022330.1.p1  ORF type:complete len:308 (+),score=65.09 GFUD01022330.1:59-982(+)